VADVAGPLSEGPGTEPGIPPANPVASPARPVIERVGLGLIALVLAVVFGAVGVAALTSGEVFLGVMAGIGALMTLWAGSSTLRR
jgi:hypothetical protein